MTSTHFIHGWNKASVANQLASEPGPLDHLAADSYVDVKKGDVLWIVAIGGGRVKLVYRFEVTDNKVSQAEAERRFKKNLWDAENHFYGVGTPPLMHDITHVLPDLVFDSKHRKRLLFDDQGRFSNQAFRVARRLEMESVHILENELVKAGAVHAGR